MDQPQTATKPQVKHGRGWTAAVVLIVLGCLLAPVGVVTAHGRAGLVDTDRFVATFAPLAQDPEVQAIVVSEATKVIVAAMDLEDVTDALLDSLEPGPALRRGLEALQGPLVRMVSDTIERVVAGWVASDAFAGVWEASLRLTHAQLNATLSGDPGALLSAEHDLISFGLGPIVAAAKTALVDQGFTLAAHIPTIEHSIPILTSDAVPMLRTGYRLASALGAWPAILGLTLVAGGVVVAPRRRTAFAWAAAGLGLSMIALLLAIGMVERMGLSAAGPSPELVRIVFDAATGPTRTTATVTTLASFALAAIIWLSGPTALARIRGGAVVPQ